jgi:hypothetical protein
MDRLVRELKATKDFVTALAVISADWTDGLS